MSEIVIFLGPSLPIEEAREILPEALFLPPVAQSDILSAIQRHEPRVIGIIDGVFYQSLSVWHKEILYALSRGIHVYGASSMGALRAAETESFGMVGIGEVYRRYASGELEDDDEVAVAHGAADEGYLVFSEALVNVRFNLRAAVEAGVIESEDEHTLLAIAKELFFPKRHLAAILREGERQGVAAEKIAALRSFLAENAVDLKRRDAVELLETVRDLGETSPLEPDFELCRSGLFEILYERDRKVCAADLEVRLGDIVHQAAVTLPDYEALNERALDRELTHTLADLMGIEATEADRKAEAQRLARRLGLDGEEGLAAWVRANDLLPEEFDRLMNHQARRRKLHRWRLTMAYKIRNTKMVLDQLRLEGRYEEAKSKAAIAQFLAQSKAPGFDLTTDHELPMGELLERRQNAAGPLSTDLKEWARDAGFQSEEELKVALLRLAHAEDKAEELAYAMATPPDPE